MTLHIKSKLTDHLCIYPINFWRSRIGKVYATLEFHSRVNARLSYAFLFRHVLYNWRNHHGCECSDCNWLLSCMNAAMLLTSCKVGKLVSNLGCALNSGRFTAKISRGSRDAGQKTLRGIDTLRDAADERCPGRKKGQVVTVETKHAKFKPGLRLWLYNQRLSSKVTLEHLNPHWNTLESPCTWDRNCIIFTEFDGGALIPSMPLGWKQSFKYESWPQPTLPWRESDADINNKRASR